VEFCSCGTRRWKILKCLWGSTLLLTHLEIFEINFLGFLRVFMGLTLREIWAYYGMNCLVCLVGGACCGALVETSMSLVFLVRDRMKPVVI